MDEKTLYILKVAQRANEELLAYYKAAVFNTWRDGESEQSRFYERAANELILVMLSIDSEIQRIKELKN